MNVQYMEEKMSQCMGFLDQYGIGYDKTIVRDGYIKNELMSFRLDGDLDDIDIAFMSTGVVAIREIDDCDESRDVIMEQGSAQLIADFIKDLKAGYACSYL